MACDRKFSEGTLWYIFKQLAFAALEMDNHRNVLPDSHFVVHFDIKNLNIWLGRSEPKAFKLGDFGGARITHDKGQSNRDKWGIATTPGWRPPESFDDTNTLLVSGATNVSVAVIVESCPPPGALLGSTD